MASDHVRIDIITSIHHVSSQHLFCDYCKKQRTQHRKQRSAGYFFYSAALRLIAIKGPKGREQAALHLQAAKPNPTQRLKGGERGWLAGRERHAGKTDFESMPSTPLNMPLKQLQLKHELDKLSKLPFLFIRTSSCSSSPKQATNHCKDCSQSESEKPVGDH